jgi:DNA-binding beta-propeller fold protein YncE
MKSALPLALLAFTGVAGCMPDTSGIDPPLDRLIYPTGLAMTKGDGHVLVANSDFDLEYNAGTLVAIDISQTLGPDGGVIADGEVSGNGDEYYVYPKIDTEQTIRIGAFASDLELTPAQDRAIVPVRGERAIVVVDVDDTKNGDLLSCGEDEERRCDSAHRVESNDLHTLPIEPYEVASLDFKEPNGQTTTLGFATHLAGGEISLFVLRDGSSGGRAKAELIDVLGPVVPSASGIAVNPENNDIFVSGRADPVSRVAVLRVLTDSENGWYARSPYFGQTNEISVGADVYGGTDARGLAVSPSGDRAFVVLRSPSALAELDATNYKFLDMTTVGSEPSVAAVYEDSVAGSTPYVFVLCFLTDQVFVVDPDLMMVVAVRHVGQGPQAIAFDRTRRLAYVANFRESTLSIIHATEPFDHLRDAKGRVVKIGVPRLPKGHD